MPVIPVPLATDSLKMIGEWVASLVHRKDEQDKQKMVQLEAAIQALMEAVTATRAYLAEIRDHPEKQSDPKQGEIAQKWMDAGTKIYPIDGGLADTYFLKADYWSDPKGWVAAGKDETLINLDRVFDLGRQALLAKH